MARPHPKPNAFTLSIFLLKSFLSIFLCAFFASHISLLIPSAYYWQNKWFRKKMNNLPARNSSPASSGAFIHSVKPWKAFSSIYVIKFLGKFLRKTSENLSIKWNMSNKLEIYAGASRLIPTALEQWKHWKIHYCGSSFALLLPFHFPRRSGDTFPRVFPLSHISI